MYFSHAVPSLIQSKVSKIVIGRTMFFQGVHVLILGTCECVTLYGKKRVFAVMIEVKHLAIQRLSWLIQVDLIYPLEPLQV